MTRLLFSLLLITVSCNNRSLPLAANNSKAVSVQHTSKKIKVAGYLPGSGIMKFDPAGFAMLDRVYYFSISPDTITGLFKSFKADTVNLEYIKSKLSGRQELFIVVGGWVESKGLPIMVADSVNKRSPYISKLVSFCKYFDVSGVDVDWEDYPEPVNRASYKQFIEQLSDSLHSKNIKLSVALGPFQKKAYFGADIKDVVENINIMTYGKLEATGKHSTFDQMTEALGFYSEAGVPKEKLIVGVPFFGKRTGSGRTPPITLSYSYIYNNAVLKPAATDNRSIINNTGYEYNNLSLLDQKVAYLRQNSYGGIMAWSLLHDTSVVSEKSLLRKIYETNQAD